jgi:4'-phosphopantetheinyl transferase
MVVDLVLCRIDSPGLSLAGHEDLFPPQRLEQLRRSVERVQRESVAGRLLLRRLLQERGRGEADLSGLGYTSTGKPFFPGGEHFNISHSGNWAACAMSDTEVGVDIQKRCPIPWGILRKYSPPEQEMLESLPQAEQNNAACILWSLKEAWCKCTGTGITVPLDAASFTLEPLGINQRGFTVLCPPPPEEGYALALCLSTQEPVELRLRIIDFSDQ